MDVLVPKCLPSVDASVKKNSFLADASAANLIVG